MSSILSLPAKIPPPPDSSRQKIPTTIVSPETLKTLTLLPTKKKTRHHLTGLAAGAADAVAFSAVLAACARARDLRLGRAVHRRVLAADLPPGAAVANSLLTLYAKCGVPAAARAVFDGMGELKDLVSWTAMVSCFAQNGLESEALKLFVEMLASGFTPNAFTFCAVVRACSARDFFDLVGNALLGFVIKSGFWGADVSVGCALIDMFAKNDDLVSARKVFDGLLARSVVVWTLLITRYGQCAFADEAIRLFFDMRHDGFEPDRFTISSVVSACTELGSITLGQQLHSLAIRTGLVFDVCVGCSLVDMYAKFHMEGSMDYSRKVFELMPEHNVMMWTALLSGYVQDGGHDEEAIELFGEMLHAGVWPNHITYSTVLKACTNLQDQNSGRQVHAHVIKSGLASVNIVGNSLVSMYAQSGCMEDARRAFNQLYEKNMISYNATNYTPQDSPEIYHQIESMDVGVSSFTFASLLSAAASVGLLSKGQQLHAQLLKAGFGADRGIGNSLVSMYSRCGNLEDACQAFYDMDDRNVISWTSMITGFAKHGYAGRALSLFHDMILAGAKPNDVTYIAVLSACSHVGLVKEGREYFRSMQRDHGLVPRMEHYACMVDLLGRSGLLEEAHEFINTMPLKADALVWRTLLGACRIHGDITLGEIAAKHILELEPQDPAAHVLLSNLYAEAGRWEDVARIRSAMKERNLSKEAGLSWMELENTIHEFHVGDTCHPQAREIYTKLDTLIGEIKELGYVPDTSNVLHDVEDELKEQYLHQHSEKIAVTFGLITMSAPKPIRIFKNLRVCGDCHSAIKYISKVTGREIILRDNNRFHRMKDGHCSCGEYW